MSDVPKPEPDTQPADEPNRPPRPSLASGRWTHRPSHPRLVSFSWAAVRPMGSPTVAERRAGGRRSPALLAAAFLHVLRAARAA